jgi:hypothetical protein
MLTEIKDIVKMFVDVITDKKNKIYNWNEVYIAYSRLKKLIDQANLTMTHYFPLSLKSYDIRRTKRFKSPTEKWVYFTNRDFLALDSAIIGFLYMVFTWDQIKGISDEYTRRKIEYHFEPKSPWIGNYLANYCSGKVDPTGKKLKRYWIQFEDKFNGHHSFFTHSDPLLLEKLTIDEEFDISDENTRVDLMEVGLKNIDELRLHLQKLKSFLKENCTIEDLL